MLTTQTIKDYYELCKPKVVALMLITAWVGMSLATFSAPEWPRWCAATFGIGLAACSAAIINHLVDRNIDAKMLRTARRPLASGRVQPNQALGFSLVLGGLAFVVLYKYVNLITTLLTFSTLLGYAVFYTMFLKRATPQNIVIGGLAGAMPPLLGWSAVSGDVNPQALLLVLIIFTWTPPHFWALAIYRAQDYSKAKIPMLPITHGIQFTKLCMLLYSILLFPVTLLPYVTGGVTAFYTLFTLLLNTWFLVLHIRFYRASDNKLALPIFNFSLLYLLLIFVGLLLDHYWLAYNLLK